MSRKAPSPTEIEWRVLKDLQALEGRAWKEAQGEYHGAYEEMAVWILLERAEDIEPAHKKFLRVISAYSDLVRFTVSYSVKMPMGEMLLDALSGNDEIYRAHSLGANPEMKRGAGSVFRK